MNSRIGLISAYAAFIYWGFVTIYWRQIDGFAPDIVLASRMILSFLTIGLYFIFSKKFNEIREVIQNKKQVGAIMICGLLLLINWSTFFYAIFYQHIIESSLGYFINPLVSVFLGVFVLKETLRFWQWTAIGIAFIGIIFLISQGVGSPWISLVLAGTFALYGLVRKMTPFPTMVGLLGETLFMSFPALAYLVYKSTQGLIPFGVPSLGQHLYLLSSGLGTIIPLVLFGIAVKNLKLSTVGLIQYLAPTLQLLVGVLMYKESFTQTHLLAFTCIWIALIIYSIEGLVVIKSQEAALE